MPRKLGVRAGAFFAAGIALGAAGCGTGARITLPFAAPPPQPAPEEPAFREIAPEAASLRAIVLMYHDVVAGRRSRDVWFDVTRSELEADLDFIAENGGTVVSMADLYEALVNGKSLPDRAVVLSFDDSYQGVYDHAAPVLIERGLPATVFVHTAYIGAQGTKPKMGEEHLKELHATGLFEIGSHTVTHPEDISMLGMDEQEKELADSKQRLESLLGEEVRWLSWPTGNNDAYSRLLAQRIGYRMAVTMKSGLAGGSPGILQVNRYAPKSLRKAWQTMDSVPPVRFASVEWSPTDVECRRFQVGRTKLVCLLGGTASSVLESGRKQVADIAAQHGAAGGVNGGFFSMAAVASTDNTMIGPCLAPTPGLFLPDPEAERLARIAMRPLVAWNSERIVFAPFSPSGMNDRESVERLLPGVTDVFVAGAWLVFDGRPLEADEIRLAATSDAMDARKRTFFGVTHDGRPIAGAGENGADSARLAKAAAAIGARYAVLLDSGFSTSLAYQGEILAWGHRNADHGSRPIPHAILFHGTAATALPVGSATVVEAGGPSTWPGTLPGSAGPRPR